MPVAVRTRCSKLNRVFSVAQAMNACRACTCSAGSSILTNDSYRSRGSASRSRISPTMGDMSRVLPSSVSSQWPTRAMRWASSSLERLDQRSSCMARSRSRNRTRSTSRRGFMPFWAKSLAPAAKASLIDTMSLRPVSIRIGSSRPSARSRILRQTSIPVIFGMLTSRMTQSGCVGSNCRTASSPSLAVCTTNPAPPRAASASNRCAGSSSAIRIVVIRVGSMRAKSSMRRKRSVWSIPVRSRCGARPGPAAPSRVARTPVRGRRPHDARPAGPPARGPRSRTRRAARRAGVRRGY